MNKNGKQLVREYCRVYSIVAGLKTLGAFGAFAQTNNHKSEFSSFFLTVRFNSDFIMLSKQASFAARLFLEKDVSRNGESTIEFIKELNPRQNVSYAGTTHMTNSPFLYLTQAIVVYMSS